MEGEHCLNIESSDNIKAPIAGVSLWGYWGNWHFRYPVWNVAALLRRPVSDISRLAGAYTFLIAIAQIHRGL